MIYRSVEEMLEAARDGLVRLAPREAADAVAAGAMIVDIRPEWQRRTQGEVPGALVVERNHLEWRLHPASQARLPQADGVRRWIVLCMEGYTSSLAARALVDLGVDATDVEGGILAWRDAGLPVVATLTPVEQVVGDSATSAAPALHPAAG